ncbi:MAG: phosphate-starvation-inducible rane protein PsiE [Thermoleophilia bacterium]|nr:phosphate-starvation-inducible rane protein PsiE [Thermoleophilia bacterium]
MGDDHTTLQVDGGGRHPVAPRILLRAIAAVDDLVHVVIAIMLLALAVAVIGHTVVELFQSDLPFALAVTYAVNGVLFVIILMEILRTVVAHFTHGTFQLLPFIAIGIISAVRHILTVGSALTIGTTLDEDDFNRLLLELLVNTGVALGLVVALVLLRRTMRAGEDLVDGGTTATAPELVQDRR